ncbi:hypothetical protein V8D89_005283 [Ganoderma adspersum]
MISDSRSPAAVHNILHCIISHLDPDPYVDPDDPKGHSIHQALAQLATTHSTFMQPALSALWRSLSNDNVLKHLLCIGKPQDSPKRLRHRKRCPTLLQTVAHFAAYTNDSAWGRFREYASLVQKIVVDPCIHELWCSHQAALLRDTFWCQISFIFGDRPILPNLKVMHFVSLDLSDPIDMGVLRLFNPSIQELSIEFLRAIGDRGNATRLRTAFGSCLLSTPNLERLSLIPPYPLLDLESVPQSHPRIRHLRVDAPINAWCLTSLSSLPDLEYLSICLLEPVTTPVHFKSLHSLSISGCKSGLESVSTLIASMDAPYLRKLSLVSSHRHSCDLRTELSHCLQPLPTQFSSLTAFDWTFSQFREFKYGYPGPRNPGGTLAELLEPLLALHALRDLSLDLNGPFVPYSTADFCRMAEAWPDLETLALGLERPPEIHAVPHPLESRASLRGVEASRGHIYGGGPGGPVQYADYDAFASFARHCPRLHTLRIPLVRIDSVTDIPGLPEGCPTGHGLCHLYVDAVLCPEAPGWGAGLRRVAVFAEMMKQVFPLAVVHWLFVRVAAVGSDHNCLCRRAAVSLLCPPAGLLHSRIIHNRKTIFVGL